MEVRTTHPRAPLPVLRMLAALALCAVGVRGREWNVVVAGPVGVGKSRLVNAAVGRTGVVEGYVHSQRRVTRRAQRLCTTPPAALLVGAPDTHGLHPGDRVCFYDTVGMDEATCEASADAGAAAANGTHAPPTPHAAGASDAPHALDRWVADGLRGPPPMPHHIDVVLYVFSGRDAGGAAATAKRGGRGGGDHAAALPPPPLGQVLACLDRMHSRLAAPAAATLSAELLGVMAEPLAVFYGAQGDGDGGGAQAVVLLPALVGIVTAASPPAVPPAASEEQLHESDGGDPLSGNARQCRVGSDDDVPAMTAADVLHLPELFQGAVSGALPDVSQLWTHLRGVLRHRAACAPQDVGASAAGPLWEEMLALDQAAYRARLASGAALAHHADDPGASRLAWALSFATFALWVSAAALAAAVAARVAMDDHLQVCAAEASQAAHAVVFAAYAVASGLAARAAGALSARAAWVWERVSGAVAARLRDVRAGAAGVARAWSARPARTTTPEVTTTTPAAVVSEAPTTPVVGPTIPAEAPPCRQTLSTASVETAPPGDHEIVAAALAPDENALTLATPPAPPVPALLTPVGGAGRNEDGVDALLRRGDADDAAAAAAHGDRDSLTTAAPAKAAATHGAASPATRGVWAALSDGAKGVCSPLARAVRVLWNAEGAAGSASPLTAASLPPHAATAGTKDDDAGPPRERWATDPLGPPPPGSPSAARRGLLSPRSYSAAGAGGDADAGPRGSRSKVGVASTRGWATTLFAPLVALFRAAGGRDATAAVAGTAGTHAAPAGGAGACPPPRKYTSTAQLSSGVGYASHPPSSRQTSPARSFHTIGVGGGAMVYEPRTASPAVGGGGSASRARFPSPGSPRSMSPPAPLPSPLTVRSHSPGLVVAGFEPPSAAAADDESVHRVGFDEIVGFADTLQRALQRRLAAAEEEDEALAQQEAEAAAVAAWEYIPPHPVLSPEPEHPPDAPVAHLSRDPRPNCSSGAPAAPSLANPPSAASIAGRVYAPSPSGGGGGALPPHRPPPPAVTGAGALLSPPVDSDDDDDGDGDAHNMAPGYADDYCLPEPKISTVTSLHTSTPGAGAGAAGGYAYDPPAPPMPPLPPRRVSQSSAVDGWPRGVGVLSPLPQRNMSTREVDAARMRSRSTTLPVAPSSDPRRAPLQRHSFAGGDAARPRRSGAGRRVASATTGGGGVYPVSPGQGGGDFPTVGDHMDLITRGLSAVAAPTRSNSTLTEELYRTFRDPPPPPTELVDRLGLAGGAR